MNQKHKFKVLILWFVAYTWGCITTIIGSIIALILLITGHKPQRFGPCVCFELKSEGGWGLNLGPFIFHTKGAGYYSLKCHECGHFISQIWWGPLNPFVISLPSAIRFWLREQDTQERKQIYAEIISGIILIIGWISLVIATYFGIIWLVVISGLIMIYGIIIVCWLFGKEIPKYANNQYVPYDEFWPEGQATREGTIFMQKYYPEVK